MAVCLSVCLSVSAHSDALAGTVQLMHIIKPCKEQEKVSVSSSLWIHLYCARHWDKLLVSPLLSLVFFPNT